MFSNRVLTAVLLFLLFSVSCGQDKGTDTNNSTNPEGPYFGNTLPGLEPEPFNMDFIPDRYYLHSSPVFSPDGKEAYFSVFIKNASFSERILFTNRDNGKWTTPELAPFSGDFFDGGPCLTPDGNKLFYSSGRNPSGTGRKEDRDIWYVERTSGRWSEPIRTPFNTATWEDVPYVSNTGYVYYKSDNDIYKVKMTNSDFSQPEKLSDAINTEYGEQHPCIAPDESFMIFYSSRPGHLGDQSGDLYITFKMSDGTWTNAVNMGPKFNQGHIITRFPRLSPDGRYLFFSKVIAMYTDKIYWVDINVIEELRPANLR